MVSLLPSIDLGRSVLAGDVVSIAEVELSTESDTLVLSNDHDAGTLCGFLAAAFSLRLSRRGHTVRVVSLQ
jgi:hypothetical protein